MEIDVDRLLQEGIMKRQQPTDNVFRLHLMSTNNDMEVEKNVLYEDVCPKIQQICHHQGQVLQVIEHPPEDAFSHSTRKQDIDSSYHCTLVLIGEKRAPTTLPKVINAREFKVLMEIGENFLEHSPLMDSFQNLSASTQLDLKQDMKSTLTFLQKHYKKDLNSVPPSFILQPDHRSSLENQLSNGTEFKNLGKLTLEKIIFCLQRIAKEAHSTNAITSEAVYKYVYPALASVTQTLKNNPSSAAQHVICIKRHFEDVEIEQIQNMQSAQKFFDLLKVNGNVYKDDQTETYLNELEKQFSKTGTLLFYSVDWMGDGVNCKHHAQYIDRVRTCIRHKLTEIVNGYKMRCADENPDQSFIQEIKWHSTQQANICSSFSGNPEILAQISKLLQNHSIRLVLHGVPGSGKTFVCGQIVKIFSELHGPSCLNLCRLLQPYDTSCHKHHVLESLLRQLYKIVQNNNNCYVGAEPTSFSRPEEALQCLLDMLASIDRPCLIVLDGIDSVRQRQLLISGFLDNLPKNVSCVLSVASDNFLNNWLNSFKPEGAHNVQMTLPLCQSSELQEISHKYSSGAIYVAKIRWFKTSASAAIINRVLKQKDRCLTAYQRDQVMTVSNKFQNALFTELLANEASSWSSFDQFEWMNKLLTVDDLLEKILGAVETDHGKKLVRQTLCYLLESKCGLSEVELVDVLHKDLLLFAPSPQERGILTFAVRNLLSDIKHLLSYVEDGKSLLLAFKHSCVEDYIREKYLRDSKASIHTKLANYWMAAASNPSPTIEYESLDDLSASQQILSDWCPEEVRSFRTFCEVPYHLIHSQNQTALNDLLLNAEWICRKIKAVSTYAVIEDFELASQNWQDQGYGRISEALSIVGEGSDDIEGCMQDFINYLHSYCLSCPKTVGKLCDKIRSWLTKREGNRYVMHIGAQTSPGPLLTRRKHRALAVTISPQTNELFAITEKGYLISYSLFGFKVNRMRRMLAFPSEDTYGRLEILQRSGGSCVLALYGSVLIGLFNMDSLECVETIPCAQGSELSPSGEFLLSNMQGNDIVIQSVSSEEIIFNSSAQSGRQRHLLFSKDDTYEIFEDIKNLSKNPHQQSVIKVLNTTTGSVTALSEVVVPTDFQVKAYSCQLQCILVGVLKMPDCSNQDFPKDILSDVQRVQLFHLSTTSRTLDIKMPVCLSYLCCDLQDDQFIAGNESKAYVYGLPHGHQSCEIRGVSSEAVIIRGNRVIFYGNSTVKVYSSRNGHLLSRWETGADNPGDSYWLSDDGSRLVKHTFLDKTGILECWTLPVDVTAPEQGNHTDPTFQSLTYSGSSGLIVGVTEDGYVATINTCEKVYRWTFSQVQIDHFVDKLVLSPDASMAVALGIGISVFDITEERLTRLNHFKQLKNNDGRFVDAVFSENNKRLAVVQKGTCQGSVVHSLQLDAADSCVTYECIQGRISLGRSKIVFMTLTDSVESGNVSLVCSYEVMALVNDKPSQKVRVSTDEDETMCLCLSTDETKFAAACVGLTGDHGSAMTLSLKIFDANELKKISEYRERISKCVDVNNIIFQATDIIIFTSLNVLKLDMTSGIFSEIVSVQLLNAVTSKDGKFFAATSSSRRIYLVNIGTSQVLVKYPVPLGVPSSIIASNHLDTLFLFARGMAHPSVLTANEELRETMHLDRISYDVPCFESSLVNDLLPCRIESVTQILLSDIPKKTCDTSESTIMSISNATEGNIRSLELRNEGLNTKTSQEIENKAYFVKQTLNKGPLKTDTVRFSKGPFRGERRPSKDNEHLSTTRVLPIGEEAHYVISSNMQVDNMDAVQRGSSRDDKEIESDSDSELVSGSESQWESSDPESTGSSYSGSTSSSVSSGDIAVKSVHELPVSAGQILPDNQRCHQEDDNLDATGAHVRPAQLGTKLEPVVGIAADSTVTSSEVSGMTTMSVKQATTCNYFASSESEQDYDGGAEDNTLSEMETFSTYSSQKGSTMYSRTDGNTSDGDQSPDTDSSLQSNEKEPISTKHGGIVEKDGGQRRVLVHRPATYNYFMSDDEEQDSDDPNNPEQDKERRIPLEPKQPINSSGDASWFQDELSGRQMNMSSDVQPRLLKDTKKGTPSKACALM